MTPAGRLPGALIVPHSSAFPAAFCSAAWPFCGPLEGLDKPLTSIIKCGAATILNLTLGSLLSYHVSLGTVAETFSSPHVLPITLQHVLSPLKQPSKFNPSLSGLKWLDTCAGGCRSTLHQHAPSFLNCLMVTPGQQGCSVLIRH